MKNYDIIISGQPVWFTSDFSYGKDIPRLAYLFPTQYDVGEDNNGYKPISFNEVDRIIKQRKTETQ